MPRLVPHLLLLNYKMVPFFFSICVHSFSSPLTSTLMKGSIYALFLTFNFFAEKKTKGISTPTCAVPSHFSSVLPPSLLPPHLPLVNPCQILPSLLTLCFCPVKNTFLKTPFLHLLLLHPLFFPFLPSFSTLSFFHYYVIHP
jgi:hypothetical protein